MNKGVLELGERDSLADVIETAGGYSSVRRGGKLLYPQKTADGQLYFSRAEASTQVLVDRKADTAA